MRQGRRRPPQKAAEKPADAAASREPVAPVKAAAAGSVEQPGPAAATAPAAVHPERPRDQLKAQETSTTAQGVLGLHDKAQAMATVPVSAPEERVEQRRTKPPAAKQPENRGIVIASMHGDLKMVIAGDSGIRLSVSFRHYPKSRRHKVQTRAETRREQSVAPVFARRGEQIREAVIETAREGIYVFSAEPEHGEAARASFTLKIYEAETGEKVAAIGTRTISGKTVVAKVLMPDAILWDDAAAFTGSMEDSDSTTKFNAQTGLYWKEYDH